MYISTRNNTNIPNGCYEIFLTSHLKCFFYVFLLKYINIWYEYHYEYHSWTTFNCGKKYTYNYYEFIMNYQTRGKNILYYFLFTSTYITCNQFVLKLFWTVIVL